MGIKYRVKKVDESYVRISREYTDGLRARIHARRGRLFQLIGRQIDDHSAHDHDWDLVLSAYCYKYATILHILEHDDIPLPNRVCVVPSMRGGFIDVLKSGVLQHAKFWGVESCEICIRSAAEVAGRVGWDNVHYIKSRAQNLSESGDFKEEKMNLVIVNHFLNADYQGLSPRAEIEIVGQINSILREGGHMLIMDALRDHEEYEGFDLVDSYKSGNLPCISHLYIKI